MSHPVGWFDRLRIERFVWSLDQRLYDLPRKNRITTRREVRENLRVAASDIGTKAALSNVGSPAQLAHEYLGGHFGEKPRASWTAAAIFLLTGQFIGTAVLAEAANAFGDGISAADPTATGTFSWHGIRYLQDTVTYTFVNGSGSSVGGAWTPIAYLLWIVGTVCVGRLWRLIPRRRGD
jgi:hypothetical protein